MVDRFTFSKLKHLQSFLEIRQCDSHRAYEHLSGPPYHFQHLKFVLCMLCIDDDIE
jgi:uncharacterized protein CbrC (UPF0167 family)